MDETTAVCDHYLHEFRTLQEWFGEAGPGGRAPSNELCRELAELSEQQARRLSALASASSCREVAAVLHDHPLHREVIL